MSNMSYCRFENTLGDLRDCHSAVEDALEEGQTLEQFTSGMSREERDAFAAMRGRCAKFIESYDELTGGSKP